MLKTTVLYLSLVLLIAKQIYDHLKCNDLLSCTQHGFLKGRSTCTNLIEAANDWTLAVQNRKSVTIAYIDFSRAFDTVSHDKLFYRLHSYGIRGDILKNCTVHSRPELVVHYLH